jgi:hypothetical protein
MHVMEVIRQTRVADRLMRNIQWFLINVGELEIQRKIDADAEACQPAFACFAFRTRKPEP